MPPALFPHRFWWHESFLRWSEVLQILSESEQETEEKTTQVKKIKIGFFLLHRWLFYLLQLVDSAFIFCFRLMSPQQGKTSHILIHCSKFATLIIFYDISLNMEFLWCLYKKNALFIVKNEIKISLCIEDFLCFYVFVFAKQRWNKAQSSFIISVSDCFTSENVKTCIFYFTLFRFYLKFSTKYILISFSFVVILNYMKLKKCLNPTKSKL